MVRVLGQSVIADAAIQRSSPKSSGFVRPFSPSSLSHKTLLRAKRNGGCQSESFVARARRHGAANRTKVETLHGLRFQGIARTGSRRRFLHHHIRLNPDGTSTARRTASESESKRRITETWQTHLERFPSQAKCPMIAHRLIFSMSKEQHDVLVAAGINPDQVLHSSLKKVMRRFAEKFHPGVSIGFAYGLHHDTAHLHAHLALCPRTAKGRYAGAARRATAAPNTKSKWTSSSPGSSGRISDGRKSFKLLRKRSAPSAGGLIPTRSRSLRDSTWLIWKLCGTRRPPTRSGCASLIKASAILKRPSPRPRLPVSSVPGAGLPFDSRQVHAARRLQSG
jgi:hypothetical protein